MLYHNIEKNGRQEAHLSIPVGTPTQRRAYAGFIELSLDSSRIESAALCARLIERKNVQCISPDAIS